MTVSSLARLATRDVYTFSDCRGAMRFMDAENPGVGGAIEEHVLLAMIDSSGLTVEKIAYGNWSGRADGVCFQDVLLCRLSRSEVSR